MAQELDPARLKCDAGHGRPVVGFANQGPDPDRDRWVACCPRCLVDLAPYDHFVFVLLDDDRSAPADAADLPTNHAANGADDPALKFGQRAADNNGP